MSRNWGISIISSRPSSKAYRRGKTGPEYSRPSSKAQLVPSGSARPRAEDIVGPLGHYCSRPKIGNGSQRHRPGGAADGGGHDCRNENPLNGDTPPLLFLCANLHRSALLLRHRQAHRPAGPPNRCRTPHRRTNRNARQVRVTPRPWRVETTARRPARVLSDTAREERAHAAIEERVRAARRRE